MTILISTQHQDLIKKIHKSAKFSFRTTQTCSFQAAEKTFNKIKEELNKQGINPFSVMYWYC